MPKCRNCKKNIKTDSAILLFTNYYVCSEECKKQYTKTEEYYKVKFLDYIWDICGKKGNFTQFKKQAEWYHDKYNYKYHGMLYAAKYWTEIEENVWQGQWGIGQIFPRAYEDSKNFYYTKEKLKNKSSDAPIITRIISVDNTSKKNNRFNINIEEL